MPQRNLGSYVILIRTKPGDASSWFLIHFSDFAHTLNSKLTKWSRCTWPRLKFDWLFCSSVCHANTVYLSVLFSLIANSWPEDLPQHLLFNWLAAFTLSTKLYFALPSLLKTGMFYSSALCGNQATITYSKSQHLMHWVNRAMESLWCSKSGILWIGF